jgi:hypothetical protein
LEANLFFGRLSVAGIRFRTFTYALALAGAALLPSRAQAQSVWGGAGSTTTTADYNLTTNWSNGVSTSAGDAAVFDANGSASVVTTGTIAPDTWTFNAASQNYTVSGSAVNFGIGLINNASAGQTISISNNISGATLSQAGASTLMLTGTNSFANTTISAGSIVLSGSGSLGNSLVTLGTTGTIATLDISGTSAGATIQGLEGNSSGVVTLGNQTLTSSNGSAANIFYGAINGSGGLTVSGGQQVLGGGNGYTGVTTVNSNAMLIIDKATAPSLRRARSSSMARSTSPPPSRAPRSNRWQEPTPTGRSGSATIPSPSRRPTIPSPASSPAVAATAGSRSPAVPRR